MALYVSSTYSTVTATPQNIASMTDRSVYVLATNVACWFRTDGTAAAVDTSGSHYLAANATAELTGDGNNCSIIKDTGESDGKCTLSLVQ